MEKKDNGFHIKSLEKIIEEFEQYFITPERIEILQSLKDIELLDMQKVSEIIGKDPILAGEILKLANSPHFGFTQKIESLEHAVILLGINGLRSLTLHLSYSDCKKKLSAKKRDLFINQIQKHSLEILNIAEFKIFPNINLTKNELNTIRTGIIIHDLGKAITIFLIKDNIDEWMDLQWDLWVEKEKNIFGFTHLEINEYLAKKWSFPQKLYEIMINHHDPDKSQKEACIVFLAHNEKELEELDKY